MKILLIAPTALDHHGRPIKLSRLHLPCLTLAMLAAVTPRDVSLRLVYETVEDIPFDETWNLVGLTGMGSGIVRAWQIADRFRSRGIPVVIGGISASLANPAWTLAHADALVIGEAEDLWPLVVEDARAGSLQPVYRAEHRPDIDALPIPRYELFGGRRFGFWRPVQATRGCPFRCGFCSVAAFSERSYRKRPVEQVVRDVRAAKRHGSRHIAFVDDNIGVDPDYCASLWEALIDEKILWMSQCGLHIAEQPDLLRLAHRSGCRILSFGIESVNEASLAAIGKEWNRPVRYSDAIRLIRSHGIDVSTEMIVGLDGDDPRVFRDTYDFIMKNAISVPRVHIMTPVPGTPLFDELERQGRIASLDFSRYSGGNVVFQPVGIGADTLLSEYWRLYRRLFTVRAIVHRIGRNRASLGPLMRAIVLAVNVKYRRHILRRISPGIV